MTGISIISLVVSLVAILAAMPMLSKFLVYYFCRPNIDVVAGSRDHAAMTKEAAKRTVIKWSDVDPSDSEMLCPFVWVINRSPKRNFYARIEYIFADRVRIETEGDDEDKTLEEELDERGYRFREKESEISYLPPSGAVGYMCPFEPTETETILTVVVYAKLRPSEFQLPRFLGDYELRPVERSFYIKP